MTIVKKHISPDKVVRTCEAPPGECKFNSENEHSYYDTSIKKNVLSPESDTQRKLDRMDGEKLHKRAQVLVKTDADKAEYQKAYTTYETAAAAHDKQKAKFVASFPEHNQGFVQQLLDSPENSSTLHSFSITDTPQLQLPQTESAEQGQEQFEYGKTWLVKAKAEQKVRSLVSSYLAR
jgi:hypothetical protein